MSYLVFESLYGGHYFEYLRHLLTFAKVNMSNDEIHFVISNKYSDKFANYDSPNNIHFHYLSDTELNYLNPSGRFKIFISSLRQSRILRKYIKRLNIDKTILLNLNKYIFGITLFTPHTSNISGIEYIIPIRNEEKVSLMKRMAYKFKMMVYAYTNQLKRVFLLNDEKSAQYYNNEYRTEKFKFLPDPIDCIGCNDSLKKEDDKIVMLHAGRFRREKGTFSIIEAFNLLSDDERRRIKFILCGQSSVKDDNDLAISKINMLRDIMDVEFYNDYVDESFLHAIYRRADFILIPYHNYYQSSGNLGHAASYNKPVIGPGRGLLGDLIRRYNLGFTLEKLDAEEIAQSIKKALRQKSSSYGFEEYVERCNPQKFASICFGKL